VPAQRDDRRVRSGPGRGLLEALEDEAGVEEGLHERAERQVDGADLRAQALGRDPGRLDVPSGLSVAGMERRHALGSLESSRSYHSAIPS
jgi:hypothetical protein